MSEDRSHLIEIGDPEDDRIVPAPAPAPHVVIEYRDRGLPWMLVLPLLVTAAAAAIIGFKAFDARIRPDGPVPPVAGPPVAASAPPPARIVPDEVPRDSGGAPLPPPSPVALPLASTPPETDTLPAPPAAPPAVAEVAASVPAIDPPGPAPTPDAVPPEAEPRPFPQVAGLGFDPDALNRALEKPGAADEVRPAGHPADAPAPDRPAVAPDGPDQPRMVDPKDLPRDPRLARRERMQRIIEDRKRLELERARFHADLLAISRRFGANAAPAIMDLCRRYGTAPDPIAMAEAARILKGAAAGAEPEVRINLLRSLGFPEASILLDIAENKGRWEDRSARNGPRSKDDVLRGAAMFLLRCPPKQGTAPASPTAAGPLRRPAGPIR